MNRYESHALWANQNLLLRSEKLCGGSTSYRASFIVRVFSHRLSVYRLTAGCMCMFVLYLQNFGLYTSRRFHLVKGHWYLYMVSMIITKQLLKCVWVRVRVRCAAALSAFLKENNFCFLPFKLVVKRSRARYYGFEYYQNPVFSIIQRSLPILVLQQQRALAERLSAESWHDRTRSAGYHTLHCIVHCIVTVLRIIFAGPHWKTLQWCGYPE